MVVLKVVSTNWIKLTRTLVRYRGQLVHETSEVLVQQIWKWKENGMSMKWNQDLERPLIIPNDGQRRIFCVLTNVDPLIIGSYSRYLTENWFMGWTFFIHDNKLVMIQEFKRNLHSSEPQLKQNEIVFQKFESPAGCIATFFGFFLIVCGMFGLSAVGYYDTIPSSMIRIWFFQIDFTHYVFLPLSRPMDYGGLQLTLIRLFGYREYI